MAIRLFKGAHCATYIYIYIYIYVVQQLRVNISSPNTVKVTKSQRMGWAEHAWERSGEHNEYLLEDVKRRHLFEELGKDERKILKSVLE